MKRGDLNRRIAFMRSGMVDDGTAMVPGGPAEVGRRWARKVDASDAERFRAGEQGQEITTRFLVRADALTRTITGKDTISYRDRTYEIIGTKEVEDDDDAIEITTVARPDQAIAP